MKRNGLKLAVCLLAGSMLFSSCIGSFGLFNKLLKWNQGLSNKFINELVFLIISPVYGLAGTADVLIFNTIEFWTGNNPMQANIGKTQTVYGQDGKQYLVKTLKNGYDITKPTGEVINFTYVKSENAWYMNANGKKSELFKMNNDGTAQIQLQNGQKMNVTLDEAGLYEAKMALNGGTYFAAR
jgi:hypothetical protein